MHNKIAIIEGQKNRVTQIFTNPSGLGIAISAANILHVFGI